MQLDSYQTYFKEVWHRVSKYNSRFDFEPYCKQTEATSMCLQISNNMQHTLNDAKVLTQSVHTATCFSGGHYHQQGIHLVSQNTAVKTVCDHQWNMSEYGLILWELKIIKCMVHILKIFRKMCNKMHGINNNVKRQQGIIMSFKSWSCTVTWQSTTYFIPIYVGALLSQGGTCIIILDYSLSQFQARNIKNNAGEKY